MDLSGGRRGAKKQEVAGRGRVAEQPSKEQAAPSQPKASQKDEAPDQAPQSQRVTLGALPERRNATKASSSSELAEGLSSASHERGSSGTRGAEEPHTEKIVLTQQPSQAGRTTQHQNPPKAFNNLDRMVVKTCHHC